MQEANRKAENFRIEIRNSQIERHFAKIRYDFLTKSTSSISSILQSIQSISPHLNTYQNIYDHQQQLDAIIIKIKGVDCTQPNYIRLLYFLEGINEVLQNYAKTIKMESEGESEEDFEKKIMGCSKIGLQIKYCLINLTGEENDQKILEFIPLISQFTKYLYFVPLFKNIFLNKLLPLEQKIKFIKQFLFHLENNPNYFFSKCSSILPTLYYAVEGKPSIKYEYHLHENIINIINKIMNPLALCEDAISRTESYEFAYKILYSLCASRQESTTSYILKSGFIIKHISRLFENLASIQETELCVQCLDLVGNLFASNHVVQWVETENKQIIINVYRALEEVGNIKIYQKRVIVSILYLVSNMISNGQICQQLLSSTFKVGQEQLTTIQLLTKIMNDHHRSNKIRIQCHYIITNCLICLTNYLQHSSDLLRKFFVQAEVIILDILKGYENKELVESVLKKMLKILEEVEFRIDFFYDSSLLARLNEIQEGEYYPQELCLLAEMVLEGIYSNR